MGRLLRKYRTNLEAWSVLGPVMLYMSIFSLFPLFFVVYLSFTEWNAISGLPKWVGLQNYIKFLSSDLYLTSLVQTAKIGGISLVLWMVLSFGVALLLNQSIKGRGIYRAIWYIPVVTSYAIVSQIVLALLDPMDGGVNKFLMSIGLDRIEWQTSTFWMIFWVTLFGLWKGVGAGMLLFLAGLQSIDPSLYEAAKMDGANAWRRMTAITIPLLQPLTAFVFVTSVIALFQLFEPIYFITKGGPNGTTQVIVYRIWKDAFSDFQMGMASVGSVVILIIAMVSTLISIRLTKSIY